MNISVVVETFLGLETLAFRSRGQDRDLGLQVYWTVRPSWTFSTKHEIIL